MRVCVCRCVRSLAHSLTCEYVSRVCTYVYDRIRNSVNHTAGVGNEIRMESVREEGKEIKRRGGDLPPCVVAFTLDLKIDPSARAAETPRTRRRGVVERSCLKLPRRYFFPATFRPSRLAGFGTRSRAHLFLFLFCERREEEDTRRSTGSVHKVRVNAIKHGAETPIGRTRIAVALIAIFEQI